MSEIPSHELNDGNSIPAIGFGTYPLKGREGREAVSSAIALGYRLIDSALNYHNEDAVGRAIAEADVPRSELVVTTKLPGRHHGYDETMASFEESRAALGLDYIDLYLIHWPMPRLDKYVDSFRAMIELKRDGRIRSIGVSNFTEEFLTRLIEETGETPSVNQVELHPYFPQVALREFHDEHGIRTEAWSPIAKAGKLFGEAAVVQAAAAHDLTPAQVVLRWHIQSGTIPLPKSGDPLRQKQNLDVFDPERALTEEELAAITALGRADGRLWDGDPRTNEEF